MGQSWSGMRKYLEQENICEPLKGRIKYFATRYRKSHDNEGRVAILLDGKEIFQSDFYDWDIKRHEAWNEINASNGRKTSYSESGEQMELVALNKGGFDQFSFYNAYYYYQNHSIDESLNAADPIVRLFAILDKRIGKRRLNVIQSKLAEQPEWLQVFFNLRLQAEKGQ